MTDEKKQRRIIDWPAVEREYRAGVKTLRQLAEEFGVSHVAIAKRAKADGWPRDIKAKIDAKAEEKVNKAAVTRLVTNEHIALTEKVVIEANAEIIASAALIQRDDIKLGMDVSRGHLVELATLANPRFSKVLEAIADAYDESGPGPAGAWKTDKVNELYRYIISLAGRVKMAKEVAASHGVYVPLQRKVLRMDDADLQKSTVDDLLDAIGAA